MGGGNREDVITRVSVEENKSMCQCCVGCELGESGDACFRSTQRRAWSAQGTPPLFIHPPPDTLTPSEGDRGHRAVAIWKCITLQLWETPVGAREEGGGTRQCMGQSRRGRGTSATRGTHVIILGGNDITSNGIFLPGTAIPLASRLAPSVLLMI